MNDTLLILLILLLGSGVVLLLGVVFVLWKRLQHQAAHAQHILATPPAIAELQVVHANPTMSLDTPMQVEIAVTNRSLFPFLSEGHFPIHLSYHWYTANGVALPDDHDGLRARFSAPLLPYQTTTITMMVEPPATAGDYLLECDLVQEQICWFGEKGMPTVRTHVQVTASAACPVVCIYNANCVVHDATSNYMVTQARFFAARGFMPLILLGSVDPRQPLEVRRWMARTQAEDLRIGTVADTHAMRRLRRLCHQAVLHIFHYPAYYPLIEWIVNCPAMVLVDYQGVTPPHLWNGDARWLMLSEQKRTIIQHAKGVVAHSSFTAQEITKAANLNPADVHILPLPVPLDDFVPQPRNPTLLARYQIRAEEIVLLYVGRISQNKRIDLLVSALALVRPQFPTLRLLLVGDNQSELYAKVAHEVVTLANQLGVAEALCFTGPIPDNELADHFRLADLFVTASLHEGFCVPVVEAMACGVPTIGSDVTALPETIGTGGRTFTAEDPEALAAAITALLVMRQTQPEAFQAQVKQAMERAAYFAPERHDERFTRILTHYLPDTSFIVS